MKLIFFIFSICISGLTKAQEYNALFIPDSLRKGADVVKRSEEYILTIKTSSKYTVYEKHVYTILNAAASHYADYITHYDKFCSINSVSGKLFNMMGKEIKHSKKSDWKDYSAYDGFSLLSDARYKENEFYSAQYPYTVEYEEEDDHNGTQSFPAWVPQGSPAMSVQYSRFTIIAPASYKIRYRQLNFKTAPVITQKGDVKTYIWEIKNIPARKSELSAPSFIEITPAVFFAPSKFEVQGYAGDMSTWEEYGKFIYQLIKGRDVLPDEVKRKVHELTGHITGDREKVFLLYDFLQKNTRYISIQLGIGGWQPFEAAYVAEKKYGDCKALSNYMIALLKEAGIKGKYVEIYAGKSPPPFVDDFSFSQFNHVISCVPLDKDTLWLECTSQTVSPGYMGSFTGNRKALLIDETGGHLVHTPVYKVSDNLQVRRVKGVADDQGNLSAEITNTYTSLQQDFPHSLMYDASKEERDKYLNQMFYLPTYQVIKNNYKEHRGIIPSVDEHLQILINNYATITGKRLFIAANLFGGGADKPLPDTARQYDYIIKDPYRDIDSVEIKIPLGYKPESLPKDIFLETKFGKYASKVKVLDDRIIYYRLMEQNSGRFPPKEYNELVNFYQQVYKADRSRVVLVKAE
ncbi:MAG: DUF3857 domain-containing protein [Ferruginibacter sp.]|nr:DUF3857 domain-containing protein [Ferruginibacter sp.]